MSKTILTGVSLLCAISNNGNTSRKRRNKRLRVQACTDCGPVIYSRVPNLKKGEFEGAAPQEKLLPHFPVCEAQPHRMTNSLTRPGAKHTIHTDLTFIYAECADAIAC